MLCRTRVKTGRYLLPCRFSSRLFCLLALTLNIPASHAAAASLTLPEALSSTLAQNPRLQVFELRLQGLEGGRLTADQNPALAAGLEVENALGSGDLQELDGAEYTLALSSVLELGSKRQARVGLIDARYGLVEAERRAETLDLLGQVTQGFIAALARQEKLALAAGAVALAETTLEIVAGRADRGAAPGSEVLRARAALTRNRIEQARLQTELESRKMALASLWGATTPDFQTLEGDLFQFGAADSFEALYQRVSDSPAIQVYASEERLRDAEVQLARSRSEGDIRWQLGIRRLEAIDDTALTASISMPLFSGRRNRGEVQAALAARNEVRYRREDSLLRLRARLFDAWQQRQQAVAAVAQIDAGMLPELTEALAQIRSAYERGRYSYVEWISAQRELLAAQQTLVDAAATALLNQALIEQLTAQPLATAQGATR
jgi:cobalt-zinc-cadmium efflux system outer membrane protein